MKWKTGRRVKIAYLISRRGWPVGLKVENAFRSWYLAQESGIREKKKRVSSFFFVVSGNTRSEKGLPLDMVVLRTVDETRKLKIESRKENEYGICDLKTVMVNRIPGRGRNYFYILIL